MLTEEQIKSLSDRQDELNELTKNATVDEAGSESNAVGAESN
jgi:hypothetical protein